PGATLTVDSRRTPALLLSSNPSAYATITSVQATLELFGTEDRPLAVRSLDLVQSPDAAASTHAESGASGQPSAAAGSPTDSASPDTDLSDGRAYIRAAGSRMDFDHVTVSNLGFLLGESSGVAWMSRDGIPATGGARDSTFTGNYFGAYSSGADGLIISRSQFTNNIVYGFDPHTGTTNTLVEYSVAARNGRHGFIFSSACDHNEIRDSESYLNVGAGFVVDDGADNQAIGPQPSDANTLLRVNAHDNGRSGIVIEGGAANSVVAARVDDNPYGIWVKNAAEGTTISETKVTNSAGSAVRLDPTTRYSTLSDSTIAASTIGVDINSAQGTHLERVTIANSSTAGIVVHSDLSGTTFDQVDISGTGRDAIVHADENVEVSNLPGLQVDSWARSTVTGDHWWDSLPFAKLLPWLLILGIPALVWIPIRWRWRRQRPPLPGVDA
ncbi:MAG: Right-handed parallel beta-helix repeat-containing protein, partial [Actinomycetota bacterium]|nr:Right-handed parallel beta-helix repeat-containing protein [Actinomycetota bacterium]